MNWLRIRGQNGNNARKISHGSKDLMENSEDKYNKLDIVD